METNLDKAYFSLLIQFVILILQSACDVKTLVNFCLIFHLEDKRKFMLDYLFGENKIRLGTLGIFKTSIPEQSCSPRFIARFIAGPLLGTLQLSS